MSEFLLRPACPADKEDVLAFTKTTWEWGDYIPYVWDEWLAQKRGELSVGTYGGKPVLLCKTTMLSRTEAWFEGLRVDPAFRRHGLAEQSMAYQIALARRQGATVARVAVYDGNTASQGLLTKHGWPRVAAFAPHACEVPEKTAAQAGVLTLAQASEAWDFITHAPAYTAGHHLFARFWAWHELTYAKLRRRLTTTGVLATRDRSGAIAALAIATQVDSPSTLVVDYADGSGEALERLAHALQQRGRQRHCTKVMPMLVQDPGIIDAFVKAGYHNDMDESGALYIYERHLDQEA